MRAVIREVATTFARNISMLSAFSVAIFGLKLQPVLAEFLAQGTATHAEDFRRRGLVAAGVAQDRGQQRLFDFAEHHRGISPGLWPFKSLK